MKKLKSLLAIILLIVLLSSCSSDSGTTQNKMQIVAKATYTNPSSNKNASEVTMNNDVVITSFKVNIREMEFSLAESDDDDDNDDDSDDDNGNGDNDDDGDYDGDDEIGLNGPWELDLLNQSAPVTTVTIANGIYEEVEFELSKNLVNTSPIFNKSIEIRGTINGTPFVFWHNDETDFEIDYEDMNQSLVVNNNSFDLVINIDLNQVLSQLDLSSATDNNGDGIIEISPNDTDGNNNLADELLDRIEDATEMDDED
jgi:PBP1b-binding outer membrane lipoprotein LpoB